VILTNSLCKKTRNRSIKAFHINSSDSEVCADEESWSGKSEEIIDMSSVEDRKSGQCAGKRKLTSFSRKEVKSQDHTDMKNESDSKLVHGKTPTNVHTGSKSDEEILKGNNQENFDLSPSPDDPMVNIFNNEFAKSVSNNTKEASKTTKIVNISVSGPFQNRRSGFTYWSVIYGDQEAWFLKSNFMKGFVKLMLTSLKFRHEEVVHCASYKVINIGKVEFGEESKWKLMTKKNGKVKTVPKMSFVFGSKTSEEATALTHLRYILDKVTWGLKTCKHNPMGFTIWKYCEQNEEAICNYMMREYHSQEAGQKKMTASVDAAFKNGYSLKLNTYLNQYMVDYDIVCVLKEEMGFRSWSDMSELELVFCFRNHTSKKNLPDWNIEEEKISSAK
jgi:hypothetical protein